MLRKFALAVTAAGGLGLAALATTPAASLPFGPGLAPTIESEVVDVQYRRCHLRRSSRWVRCRGYYLDPTPIMGPDPIPDPIGDRGRIGDRGPRLSRSSPSGGDE